MGFLVELKMATWNSLGLLSGRLYYTGCIQDSRGDGAES